MFISVCVLSACSVVRISLVDVVDEVGVFAYYCHHRCQRPSLSATIALALSSCASSFRCFFSAHKHTRAVRLVLLPETTEQRPGGERDPNVSGGRTYKTTQLKSTKVDTCVKISRRSYCANGEGVHLCELNDVPYYAYPPSLALALLMSVQLVD